MDVSEARKQRQKGRKRKPKVDPRQQSLFKPEQQLLPEEFEAIPDICHKKWTKEEILKLIENDRMATMKALVLLYQRQTPSEQHMQSTITLNMRGFNKHDAELLSSIAKWYLNKGFITNKQLAAVRNRIRKYWKQLVEIANERERNKALENANLGG